MSTLDVFTTAASPWTAAVHAVTDWDATTACEGWSARDLVEHVVSTERAFFADRGLPLSGPASSGPPSSGPVQARDPAAAWDEHRATVEEALADPAVAATEYEGWFGPTTLGASFEQFYVFDLYVHRWDLARGVGLDTTLTAAELDRLEGDITSWGEALYMEGICKAPLEAPAEADRQTRVLALLGRS